MSVRFTVGVFALVALLSACGQKESAPATQGGNRTITATPVERDRFTHANYDEMRVTHVDLDITVDFEAKTISGVATLDVERVKRDAAKIILDTNGLEITSVEVNAGRDFSAARYALGAADALLGAPLEIELPPRADKIRIAYATSPDASGLQWLSPEQTDGKRHPYMYSQNQAIHARSMAPLQDTPAVRMTYTARVRTPPELLAVMSAEQDGGPRDGDYSFRMPQPVPSYLIAIAVGDLSFKPIGDHMGVYSEAGVLDAAVAEFSDTPKMEEANAALYGPYRWGRYDMLVLPASFPYGGMENPRLSFLTPTLIAGDKSLTNVVAHELAHSWSGNLVTNATWRDAWLNEGFTSYVENRVMEALYGRERALMEQALGMADMKRDIAAAARPELTQLKLPADLKSPEEAFSQVAYEKGAFFVRFLETRFGREAFDPFLKSYFDTFAFRSITTEDFLAFLDERLRKQHPGAVTDEEIREWVYGQGVPSTFEAPKSDAFARVEAAQQRWLSGAVEARSLPVSGWTTHEWVHFISTLPDAVPLEQLAALDEAHRLSAAGNVEIANVWYLRAIRSGYEPAMGPLEEFLLRVGRGKFIYHLYTALKDNGREAFAGRVYDEARPGYHPIAQGRIDKILNRATP